MGWNPESQILAMDRMGIDIAYLYPTMGLFLWHQHDLPPALATGDDARRTTTGSPTSRPYDAARLRPVTALSLARRRRRARGGAAQRSRSTATRRRLRAAESGRWPHAREPRARPAVDAVRDRGDRGRVPRGRARPRAAPSGDDRFTTDFARVVVLAPDGDDDGVRVAARGRRARAPPAPAGRIPRSRAAAGCRTGCGGSTSAGSTWPTRWPTP